MKLCVGDSVYCSKDRVLGIITDIDNASPLHFNISIIWADRADVAYNDNPMASKYRRAYLKLRKNLSL